MHLYGFGGSTSSWTVWMWAAKGLLSEKHLLQIWQRWGFFLSWIEVMCFSREDLSADFQTAEFLEKHGFVDKVINRKDIPREIGKLLEILLKKNSEVNSELINETSTNIIQPTKVAS